MSPAIFLHATRQCTRGSIGDRGLIQSPGQPIYGVYVFDATGEWGHPTRGRSAGARRVVWSCGPMQDVYRVAYIGPMTPDPYVVNGVALLERVPPEHVTLVTGNQACRELPTTENELSNPLLDA